MTIILEYPIWFVFFCLLLGVVYSFILYRKGNKLGEVNIWIIRFMFFLRFVVVSLLSFLLLSPFIKTIDRLVEKPIIIIAQDNTESIAFGKDSSFLKNEYKQKLNKLINDLSDKYEVRSYLFGDKTTEISNFDSLNFVEKQTDISSFLNDLENRYSNRNVGTVIIASDGIYNKGSNPIYVADKLKCPIYTIALGDTAIKKDIILSKVEHNRLAYLGNKFPIEIFINAKQLKGKSSVLTVAKGAQNLFSQVVEFKNDAFNLTVPVLLDAKEVGLQQYKITLSSLPEEVTVANNYKNIFIDVLDSREKILILSDAPHPDIAALKQSIESNQNYEVESFIAENFNQSLKKYNLVILHSVQMNKGNASKFIQELEQYNIPVLIFSGANGLIKNGFNYSISSKTNDIEPILESSFPLFTISDELRKAIKDFPAVSSPYTTTQQTNNSNVLLYQKIGVVDTKNVLLQFYTQNENKIAVFSGEGIWRWRLQDYAARQSHQLFDELISKIVQYLSVKEDKSFFRVVTKKSFLENETVNFEAELYNQSYELINEPEINITISNSDGKKYPFSFSKTINAYRLSAGVFPVGEYKYQAQVKIGDKIYNQNGIFSVIPLQVELTNTTADHQLLFSIAQKHDGELIYANQLDQLADILEKREDVKSVSYSEKKLNDLINLKWVFFLLLSLLSIEWFMRKRSGSY